MGVWANQAALGVPPIHTKPTRWPYGGICGLILPPGVDSYRNLAGGGQGVGCFISLRVMGRLSTKAYETTDPLRPPGGVSVGVDPWG